MSCKCDVCDGGLHAAPTDYTTLKGEVVRSEAIHEVSLASKRPFGAYILFKRLRNKNGTSATRFLTPLFEVARQYWRWVSTPSSLFLQ